MFEIWADNGCFMFLVKVRVFLENIFVLSIHDESVLLERD